jgi:hypothetical protein
VEKALGNQWVSSVATGHFVTKVDVLNQGPGDGIKDGFDVGLFQGHKQERLVHESTRMEVVYTS